MKVMIAVIVVLTGVASYVAGQSARPDEPLSQPADLMTFERALTQTDPLDRAYHYNAFLQVLGPDEIAAVAEIIESQRLWLSDEELQNFFLAWAKFDAPAAFQWAMGKRRPGRFRQRVAPAAMFAWGYQNPPAANRTFRSMGDSAKKLGLHEQLIAGWVLREDKTGVARYIAGMSPGSVRQVAASVLTTELMRVGPEAVIAWVESIPDDARSGFKRVAFEKAANAMTIEDPSSTALWIEDHLDRPYSAAAPAAIGRRWVEQDPSAAMEWLAGLAEGDAGDGAVATVFRHWHGEAAVEAEEWLRSATPREGLDQAVRLMVRRDVEISPILAVEWAARIENEERRERVLIGLAEAWYRRDPNAADAWLGESGLAPEVQATIRSKSQGGRQRRGGAESGTPGRG